MKVYFLCILRILAILFLTMSVMALDYLYLFFLILFPHPPKLSSLGSSRDLIGLRDYVFF